MKYVSDHNRTVLPFITKTREKVHFLSTEMIGVINVSYMCSLYGGLFCILFWYILKDNYYLQWENEAKNNILPPCFGCIRRIKVRLIDTLH